ncbi:hypothetical protein ACFV9D_18220 [Streptomyces sp. NPDC059875]|uniref:hypothetical protein n=1 Tax=unclassified Streptomyces TaxID=2593676 RepID=UPI00364AE366
MEDGDDLGGSEGEELSVENQVAGLVGAVSGGLAGVLEVGILVRCALGRGGGRDDANIPMSTSGWGGGPGPLRRVGPKHGARNASFSELASCGPSIAFRVSMESG